jgi:hypothetical protein
VASNKDMEILRQNEYNIVHLTDGKSIVDAIKLINSKKADGINFNFTKNFPADLHEIKLAPDIKYIQINDYTWDFDYSAINNLQKLEHLSIYTTDKKEINFALFPNLKNVTIFWRPKASSLFDSVNLERLFLGKYSDIDLSKLSKLTNLKYLRLNTGVVKSLKGIENCKDLETLMLMQNSKLEDISGIEKLQKLKRLRIDNCRSIKNIDVVKELKSLDSLEIVGTTPKPL